MRLLVWLLIASSQAQGERPVLPQSSAAAQSSASADSRAAFLKLIDRPTVPLAPVLVGRAEYGDLIEERITFASQAGERVPTLLIRTQAGGRQRPVVIALHGTGGTKEGQAGRLRELAGRGFIAVAIDGRYHGERAPSGPPSAYQDAIARAYRTGSEHPFLYDTVWDVMRLIDYLQAREDVDATRIGLMGNSKGGMEAYLAAAVDRRIAVAVPLIGVQSFRWALEHSAWDSRAWTLRGALDARANESGTGINVEFMRKFYDRVAPGVYGEFDGPAMLRLIAPRPLLVINGDSDPRTPVGGVRECMAAAERAYTSEGVPDRVALLLQSNTGHEVTREAERAAVAWFERWLKPSSD